MIDSIKQSKKKSPVTGREDEPQQEQEGALLAAAVKPYIIGVAGGSGSGKTYFCKALLKALGPENCELVYQDNFYFDQSQRFDFDGGSVNFDHPSSIDFSLLAKSLQTLKAGQLAQIPTYDFATHARSTTKIPVQPRKIIIVDGILIFHPKELRCLFDELIFFETSENLRFQRRLARDVKERGRTPEGVRQQFLKQVKPMHDEFVEPSKKFAKTLVKETGDFEQVLSSFIERLQKLLDPCEVS